MTLSSDPSEPNSSAVADAANTTASTLAQMSLPDMPLPVADGLAPLASLRAQQHLSLESVASSLRLSVGQINAIETQDWQSLPAAAYVKGFIKNYCRLLNTAPEPYLEQFNQETGAALVAPSLGSMPLGAAPSLLQTGSQINNSLAAKPLGSIAHNTLNSGRSEIAQRVLSDDPQALSTFSEQSEHESGGKRVGWGIAALIALTLAFLAYWEHASWLPKLKQMTGQAQAWVGDKVPALNALNVPTAKPKATEVDAKGASGESVAVPSAEVAPNAANSATTEVSAGSGTGTVKTLSLAFQKNVWVEIKDAQGTVVSTGSKQAGTSESIKAQSPVNVVIGAVDAVSLSVDGQPYDLLAQSQGNVGRLRIE